MCDVGRVQYADFAKKFLLSKISRILQKMQAEQSARIPRHRFYITCGMYGFTKCEAKALLRILNQEAVISVNCRYIALLPASNHCIKGFLYE